MIDKTFIKYLIILSILYVSVLLLSVFIFPSIFQMHEPMTADTVRIMSIQDPNEFFKTILFNNIVASFVIVIIGCLGMRWAPTFFLLFNAFYLGELIATANKPDTYMFIYGIVPHGVIELPTLVLAATFGCYLAYKIRQVTNTHTIREFLNSKVNIYKTVLQYGIKPYLFIILPLIIISAIIETYVSLYIIRIIFNGS